MYIAIYGVGAFGQLFYEALNGKIDFFIDDFSKDKFCLNKPIKKIYETPKETQIYISPLQHSQKIKEQLENENFKKVLNFTDSIKAFPNILEIISRTNYLWLVSQKDKMLNKELLNKVLNLLKDQKSKDILIQMIRLRESLDTKFYINPSDISYFPSDIPILNNLKNVNFVDCGAYTGDTIEELTKQTSNINYTISFEPDQKNLIKLEKQLQILKNTHKSSNFIIYPAGVYSRNDILKFSNNGIDSSAGLDNNSTLSIPVVSLDTVLLNSSPNYIKMDIEGAEKEAILGATKTIQKYKPNLAICLYHKPEDLWKIPLLIHKIEPSYTMYIRVHEDMCLSTVLYCISE